MDIDDPVLVGFDEGQRDFPQKSRQYQEVDLLFLEFGDIGIAPEELFFFDQQVRNVILFGDVEYARVRVVANDQADADGGVIPEVFDYTGGIGTCA